MDTKKPSKRLRCTPAVFSHGEILGCLVASGLLDSFDLGRLLLLTSKELKHSFQSALSSSSSTAAESSNDESVWKAILVARCGQKVSKKLFETSQMSSKCCFAQMFQQPKAKDVSEFGPSCSGPFRIRPLRYTPSDYVLAIALDGLTDKTIYQVICGEDIPNFFEQGTATIPFDARKPVTSASELEDKPGAHLCKYNFSIRIVRLSDQRNIRLGGGTEAYYVDPKDDGTNEVVQGCESSCSIAHSLSNYGKKLLKVIDPTSGRNGCVFGGCVKPEYEVEKNESTAVTLVAKGLTLMGMFDTFEDSGGPIAWREDLKFAHLLEALACWDDPVND